LPIRGELFRPPNVIVVILDVITEPLREVAFAIIHPLIVRIARSGGEKIPIAGVLAV
jgi:hypothetical protein